MDILSEMMRPIINIGSDDLVKKFLIWMLGILLAVIIFILGYIHWIQT